MKRAVFLLIVLLLTLPSPAAQAAGNAAEDVLRDAIEAIGGDSALSGIKAVRAEFKGTYYMGEMGSPYTSTMVFAWPDQLVWELDAGVFKGATGAAKGKPWTGFMMPAARCRGALAQSMIEWLRHWDTLLLRPLLHRTDVKIELGEVAKGDEGVKDIVILTFSDGQRTKLFFGPSGSGKTTLIRIEGTMTNMDGRKGTFTQKLSAPKSFGEVTLPSVLEFQSFADGEPLERMREEIVAVEWNPKVEDAMFACPDTGLKFGEPSVKEVQPITGLSLMHTGPYDKMGETIKKAAAICAERKLSNMGQAVAIFLDDPTTVEPEKLRTQIVIPVMLMGPPPTDLPEGAKIVTLPAAKVASMHVRGEYGTVEQEAMTKLVAWLQEHEHGSAGRPRIIYHHNPDMIVPEDQVCEPQFPVK